MTERAPAGRMEPLRRIPLYLQILMGMVLGGLCGAIFGPATGPWGEVGSAIIQLIKVLAVPLLFFSILDAFIRTELRGRAAARMVVISLTNTLIALGVGLAVSNVFQAGRHLQMAAIRGGEVVLPTVGAGAGAAVAKFDLFSTLVGYVPKNLLQPFIENSVISVILLAVLFGAGLRAVKTRQIAVRDSSHLALESVLSTLLSAIELVLGWVIRLVPIAVFSVTAKTVGEHGLSPLKGLSAYVGVALLGLLIQVVVVYQAWLIFVARIPLGRFWRAARDPIVYALGASSSLATLPVTLRSLDHMGVSRESSRLAACVGTNLNNDGILLYEAMAVLFVAQAHGIALTIPQQISAMVVCLFAGIGIAGVPDAGLISLSLVLTTVGLPLELLPLLLTVDWILSRARASTNVISDMLVSVLLDSTRPSAS